MRSRLFSQQKGLVANLSFAVTQFLIYYFLYSLFFPCKLLGTWSLWWDATLCLSAWCCALTSVFTPTDGRTLGFLFLLPPLHYRYSACTSTVLSPVVSSMPQNWWKIRLLKAYWGGPRYHNWAPLIESGLHWALNVQWIPSAVPRLYKSHLPCRAFPCCYILLSPCKINNFFPPAECLY